MRIGSLKTPEMSDRERLRREQHLRLAMSAKLTELRRSDLEHLPFGTVRHADGRSYRIARGELLDARFMTATAYCISANGSPIFLEPLP
jgi:hypothetical protein